MLTWHVALRIRLSLARERSRLAACAGGGCAREVLPQHHPSKASKHRDPVRTSHYFYTIF